MSDESPPVLTIGRYQAIGELGRGGMGIVYRGYDPVIGRTVALKTITFATEDVEVMQLRQRLYREASAGGTLTHPNIVTIYDIIEDGHATAVAMELVEGQTLASLIRENGALPLDRALDLFAQICSALDYAGSKGIVHRDIKPANILLTPDGRAKIADFGIARMSVSTLTQTGTIMGSPSYMSPEQVRGHQLDSRSDLFSAAVVLYEMLTGERPFGGDDVATTMYRIVNEPPRALDVANLAINPSVSRVLERALAKQPSERYQTGAELMADLWRSTGTDSAASAPPVQVAVPGRRRSPLLIAGIGLGVVLVILVVLIVMEWDSGRPSTLGGGPMSAVAPPVSVPASPIVESGSGSARSSASPPAPLPTSLGAATTSSGQTGSARGTVQDSNPLRSPAPATPATAPTMSASPVEPPAASPALATPRPVSARPTSPSTPAGTRRAEPTPAAGTPVAVAPTTPPAPGAGPPPVEAVKNSPAPSAPSEAQVRVDFEGPPYPVTLFAGDTRLGRIDDASGSVTVEPGALRMRAVNEGLFLNADLGTMTVRAGERRTVTLPGLASAVFSVKGEDYAGVRILVDGRQLPGPYPAQVARLAAGSHQVTYRWVSGAGAGREVADTITLTATGHFIIRAALDNGQIVNQQLR